MIDINSVRTIAGDKLVLVDLEERVFITDRISDRRGLHTCSMDDDWLDARTFDLVSFKNIDHLEYGILLHSLVGNPTIDTNSEVSWESRFQNGSRRRKLKSSLEVWITNGCDIRIRVDPETVIDRIWTESRIANESNQSIYKLFLTAENRYPGKFNNYMLVECHTKSGLIDPQVAKVLSEYRNQGLMLVKESLNSFLVASIDETLLVEARLKMSSNVSIRTFTRKSLINLRDRRFDLI